MQLNTHSGIQIPETDPEPMTISKTSSQYDRVMLACKDIFIKKMKDYGSAWRILRLSSITDQIYIKAQRIRSIEEKGIQKIEDGVDGEFIGIQPQEDFHLGRYAFDLPRLHFRVGHAFGTILHRPFDLQHPFHAHVGNQVQCLFG